MGCVVRTDHLVALTGVVSLRQPEGRYKQRHLPADTMDSMLILSQ